MQDFWYLVEPHVGTVVTAIFVVTVFGGIIVWEIRQRRTKPPTWMQ